MLQKEFLCCKKSDVCYTANMSKNMGRPILKSGDRKEVTISLRVKLAEREAMERAAAKAGKKFSEWARNRLLSADDVLQ